MRRHDLDAIRDRSAAATVAPWYVEGGAVYDAPRAYMVCHVGDPAADKTEKAAANADFIACARTDVPVLLAEVDRLRAALDAIATDLDAAKSDGAVLFAAYEASRAARAALGESV